MSTAATVGHQMTGTGRPPSLLRARRTQVRLAQAAVILAAIGLWELLYVAHVAGDGSLPSPGQVGSELGTLVGTSGFWASVLETLWSWAIGMAISIVIAVPVGLFIGASTLAFNLSRASIDFIRTLPPVALIPIVALLYGATTKTALVLIIFSALWPLMLQAMHGIRQVDPVAKDTARTYRLGLWLTARAVWLPSALPSIATGVRIASTLSLLVAVAVELIAGAPGLGNRIGAAEAGSIATTMYAYIFTTACIGVILTALLVFVERRALASYPAYQKRG